MKVTIKNLHVIRTLIKKSPEMLFEINLKKDSSHKFKDILAAAEENKIQINFKHDLSAVCKAPIVRDIKSDQHELGNLVMVLDEVQDTRNLGSCLRSASFFGVDAIIIPKNNSADYANPAVIETSTGGIYDLNLYKVSNISQTIQQLKENSYWISGFSEHGSNFIDRNKLDKKNVLIFGNEEKGIRQLVQKSCDQILKINQIGQTSSLNVSVATAIALYEATKT
jgi:23S rRNA (guanosine2251-2'-O)-methyltransferase